MKQLTHFMAAVTIVAAILLVICTLIWSIQAKLAIGTIIYMVLCTGTFSSFVIWIILESLKNDL